MIPERAQLSSEVPAARPWAILAVILVVAAVVVGLPMAAPLANGLKPFGLPMGYWLAAQGVPLVLVCAALLATRTGGGR